MIKDFGINEYEFPEAKSIVVSGDTGNLTTIREQHIATADKLVSTRLVDDSTRVGHLHNAESKAHALCLW